MQPTAGNKAGMTVRGFVGAAARRARRQAQWFAVRSELTRGSSPSELDYVVATHRSPLVRQLAGVDPQLQHSKIVNLRLAATQLNEVVLRPGQRLSFWHLVGNPTYAKGYVDGLVISHGRIGVGVGGGLCQMTNLLYWMTLHTPLEVVERWRHSYDVFPDSSRTQPFGSGATCAWPALDLQIVNPTTATFRLTVNVGDDFLTGSWTSDHESLVQYQIEERAHRISHEGPGVYVRHNELWRLESQGETTVERLVAANHALMMYEPFLQPAPAASHSITCRGFHGGALQIGRATTSDLSAIGKLHVYFWGESSDVESMARTLEALADDPDHVILAARVDGECVGTATGAICHGLYGGYDTYMVVEDMVVAEDHRRRGIASALLAALEVAARERGCNQIILLTESEREAAVSLYEANGYATRWTGCKKKL